MIGREVRLKYEIAPIDAFLEGNLTPEYRKHLISFSRGRRPIYFANSDRPPTLLIEGEELVHLPWVLEELLRGHKEIEELRIAMPKSFYWGISSEIRTTHDIDLLKLRGELPDTYTVLGTLH